MSREMERLGETSEERDLPTLDHVPDDRISAATLDAVAHEIRNPLTAVGGFARRLAEVLDPSSDGGRYARVILEEATRLEEVLARMSAGTGP
jgi:nitrogen-specific signal transduction histidine kinase